MGYNAWVETQYWPPKRGVPKKTLGIALDDLREILSENEERWARGETGGLSLAEDIYDTIVKETEDLDEVKQ